jgi:hypothetical protein
VIKFKASDRLRNNFDLLRDSISAQMAGRLGLSRSEQFKARFQEVFEECNYIAPLGTFDLNRFGERLIAVVDTFNMPPLVFNKTDARSMLNDLKKIEPIVRKISVSPQKLFLRSQYELEVLADLLPIDILDLDSAINAADPRSRTIRPRSPRQIATSMCFDVFKKRTEGIKRRRPDIKLILKEPQEVRIFKREYAEKCFYLNGLNGSVAFLWSCGLVESSSIVEELLREDRIFKAELKKRNRPNI